MEFSGTDPRGKAIILCTAFELFQLMVTAGGSQASVSSIFFQFFPDFGVKVRQTRCEHGIIGVRFFV